MYTTLIVLSIVVLTQVTKQYIYPKWGNTGVHAFIFILGIIGAGIYEYAIYNNVFHDIIIKGLDLMLLAVGIYETILSKIGFDGVSSINVQETNKAQAATGQVDVPEV